MIRAILRWFGYYRIDYGFATGRHWIEIDGKEIYQGGGADVWLRDEDVHALGYHLLDHGRHWDRPLTTAEAEWMDTHLTAEAARHQEEAESR